MALENTAILVGVKAQHGEWVASRGGAITIHEPTLTAQSIGDVNIVLFPADRLGELADANALAKIPNETVMPPKPVVPGDGSGESDRSGDEREAGRYVPVHGHRAGDIATRSPVMATIAWPCPAAVRRSC